MRKSLVAALIIILAVAGAALADNISPPTITLQAPVATIGGYTVASQTSVETMN
jgi:hypothetical protein